MAGAVQGSPLVMAPRRAASGDRGKHVPRRTPRTGAAKASDFGPSYCVYDLAESVRPPFVSND